MDLQIFLRFVFYQMLITKPIFDRYDFSQVIIYNLNFGNITKAFNSSDKRCQLEISIFVIRLSTCTVFTENVGPLHNKEGVAVQTI